MPLRRRRLLANLLAVSALSVAGVPAIGARVAAATTPAAVSVNELTPAPADGIFHLEGHGFGGGAGLSQWGAQGGAEQGASAATILSHYYPTTTLTPVAPSSIRVLLSGTPSGSVPLTSANGLTVTGADGAATTPPADPAHAHLRLVVTGRALRLQNSADGTTWSSEAAVAAPATITDSAAAILVGEADGTTKSYRGELTVSVSGANPRAVDDVAMEDYLRGVVPRESPASWLPAALQAQAVAARTYAAYLTSRAAAGSSYDLCDTSACQVYGGAGAETANTDAAVAATAGQELLAGGAPIAAQYGASNGGWTVDGGQPYLAAVADPWDGVDAGNTNHSWTATLTASQVQAKFPAVGTLTALAVTRRDGNGDFGGRALTVVLTGHDAAGNPTSVATTGGNFGLRSSWWHVAGQTSTIAATPVPTTIGLQPVTPFRVVETAKQSTTARRVVITGLHGVPANAAAVFVVASTGRLSKAQHGDLLVWPSGSSRTGALALARLSGASTATGSGLVRLGPDGALDVATSTSTAGLELTVLGWAGTSAAAGFSATAGSPLLTRTTVSRGTHALAMPKTPVGALAALVSVTGSSVGRAGNLTVAGAPIQTLSATPQTTTLLVPPGAKVAVSQPARLRVQFLGWLTPTGARLTTLRAVGRATTTVGSRGGFIRLTGAPVPAGAKTVVSLLTETSAVAGDVSTYPHGSTSGQVIAAPQGRAVTTLLVATLKDGLLVVKSPAKTTKVQLTVLGWGS